MLRFDHAILAVRDFDAAAKRLREEHGLASVPGGRHAGLGTANRIVPLGHDYLELMGIADAREAEASPLGRWLREATRDGDRLAALCLRTDDVAAVATRLGLQPLAMSRVNDAGTTVSWRLAGLEAALAEPPLPFFIEWDPPAERHPGRASAPHGVEPLGIAWAELATDVGRLSEWLGPHGLDLRAREGGHGLVAVGIATAGGGEIVLRR
jgi:hypothetical protein